MSRSNVSVGLAVTAALAVLAPPPSAAQTIEGQVVLAGWHEPVPAIRVQLLDADLVAVSTVDTDTRGRFAFPAVTPGTYFVQAVQGEIFSTIEGPIAVEEEGSATAELTVRSALFDRARACLAGGGAGGRAVLAGIAYDASTDTPLPGARVRVEWRDESGTPETAGGDADASGRFVLCELPAAVGLTVWVESLGRTSERERDVHIEGGAIARMDIPVDLGDAASVRVLDTRSPLRPDEAATLEGRLLDAESGSPIVAADIRLSGDQRVVTDRQGRFRFTNVPPGDHSFEVHRLGYDWESGPVTVAAGTTVVLELRAAPRAVDLDAVVVRATSTEARMARGATQAPRIMAGIRLRDAETRGTPLSEVIREFPNLSIRDGRFETSDGVEQGLCIESSRAMHRYAVPEKQTHLPWCEMIAIVVDGVATIRGTEMFTALRLWEIESIEFLPPIGAIRWGERAAINGALVIWTRGRGPHRDDRRE